MAETQENATQSKFAQFIADKKLDPRRIIIASFKIEGLRPEDRAIRLNKRRAKAAADSAPAGAAKETRKARSGRPVTDRAMAAALSGGAISGPTKTRLVRAVNHLLEQKKQEAVELRVLF